jgi:hypothetical protein
MEAKETEKKFLQYVGKIAVEWPTIREKELQEVRNKPNSKNKPPPLLWTDMSQISHLNFVT